MKQIKVKPIQVEPIHVSPILVTSTSVESIHVSGEETVNTTPVWGEVNRVVQTTKCQKNAQNENTGTLVTWYVITYEDQNKNSSTYGNTKTEFLRVDTYDTIACPLPEPEPEPEIYRNAAVDYDGNYYDAVIVGDQVWLTSNLKATHYVDGTALTERQVGYQTGGGVGASGYLVNSSNFYYGDVEAASNFISDWMLPSGSICDTLFTNHTVKDVASKTNWVSSNVIGSPGKNPDENNSTLLNFEPIGTYSSQYAKMQSKNELAVFWEISANSYGEKDYFGVYYSSLSPTRSSSYGVMMPIRLIYNGTVEQFLANYVDLNPSNE